MALAKLQIILIAAVCCVGFGGAIYAALDMFFDDTVTQWIVAAAIAVGLALLGRSALRIMNAHSKLPPNWQKQHPF
jgi:hypothetical protein